MLRIFIAGLLGGVAMYIWSSIAHVATPLGTAGVSTLPNESVTVDNLASSIGNKGGLFLFPMNANASASAATAPGGFLVYNPKSPTSMQPSNLIVEFATELVEAILAAWLLAQTALAGYLPRVGFVTVVGAIGAIVTNVPYWNWYAFPLTYTLTQIFVTVVAFLVAGLAIAAYLKPRTA
ncbi:MAG: hypothetical protein ISS15_17945 [Alphaproteobacteria bacterium]|nr:hypothetical protein [Alphaproteobacteria bacterium]MBL7099544.1 hypothetical protein [Alphaproteobacteria bacterium]